MSLAGTAGDELNWNLTGYLPVPILLREAPLDQLDSLDELVHWWFDELPTPGWWRKLGQQSAGESPLGAQCWTAWPTSLQWKLREQPRQNTEKPPSPDWFNPQVGKR